MKNVNQFLNEDTTTVKLQNDSKTGYGVKYSIRTGSKRHELHKDMGEYYLNKGSVRSSHATLKHAVSELIRNGHKVNINDFSDSKLDG